MFFHRAIASAFLLFSGSTAAFNMRPSGRKEGRVANKNLANVFAAGVISAAATLLPLPNPAVAADVAMKAVDGLLAIPDSSVTEYSGVLKQVVYSGVNKNTCVSLGGSGAALSKIEASAAVQSVAQSKLD